MSTRIIQTSDAWVLVAVDDASAAPWACTFHRTILGQQLVALRFANWVEMVKASLLLWQAGFAHRISDVAEDADAFFSATAAGGVHLFLDDPPGPTPDGAVRLQLDDHQAAVEAVMLLVEHPSNGGAVGSWLAPCGTPYRLAAAAGKGYAIRRASAEERALGLGFVHLTLLACGTVVMSVGWPEDPKLEAELVEAEARLAAVSAPRGDA